MYCPKCLHPNSADATECAKCLQNTVYFRDRVFIGNQFIFVQADDAHPIALQIDDAVQTYDTPAIISRHRHAVSFGDEAPAPSKKRRRRRPERLTSLPDQPQLPKPALDLLTIVTDRKIYKPGSAADVFIIAPDAADTTAELEVKIAGQKVYEAKVPLNRDGLGMHQYVDTKEGEYTAVVTLPDKTTADCKFSVAEFTLSPLIAILEKHEYAAQHLKFTLKLLLLSVPYSGSVEFGLQCAVCGDRVVATQTIEAKNGIAEGDFDLSGHGGPFHVQVITPDGNTALVAFPGTGAVEREHIQINPLGQTAEMGLLPWADVEKVRGFYIGRGGEVNVTPLILDEVHAERGTLRATVDVLRAQIVTFNPRSGEIDITDEEYLSSGSAVGVVTAAPYTLFTVGAFTQNGPFEGWGVVIRPVDFEATITAPETAAPGDEIDIYINVGAQRAAPFTPAFCWLLVYDARLEHESPVPKLAKRIYESVRNATGNLKAGVAPSGRDSRWAPPDDFVEGGIRYRTLPAGPVRAIRGVGMPKMAAPLALPMAVFRGDDDVMLAEAEAMPMTGAVDTKTATMVLTVAPTRMEFPELVHSELLYLEGSAARTVKLGDQIGTWRARAYVFRGADYRELTADIQADKPMYAELDLPAIASAGDEITAAVNYFTREPAELIIATAQGETRTQVTGSGTEHFALTGPGRVEVRIENPSGADWTARDVAWPGVQRVTASRLMILDKGQTARGEKVIIYASLGQVLKDTITALIHYPFG